MLKFINFALTFLMVPLLGVGVDGCGTLAGNPEENDPPKVASIVFAITDAPINDAKHVYITVESLEISSSGGWIDIPLAEASEIDLLTLQNGTSTVLGSLSSLSAGTYQQTRLKLSSSKTPRLVDKDGTEHELTIPSGSESGLKINTSFTVEEGQESKFTIDFDVRKSIKTAGNANSKKGVKYMMKPVLRLIKDIESGTIKGAAADGSNICIYEAGATLDSTDECDNAENSAIAKAGEYQIGFVKPGTYKVRIFADDGTYSDKADIVVKASKETKVE